MKKKPILKEYVFEWQEPKKGIIDFEGEFEEEQQVQIYLRSSFSHRKKVEWVTKVYSCDYTDLGKDNGREYVANTETVLFNSKKDSIKEYLSR